jgi:hypothetical protein
MMDAFVKDASARGYASRVDTSQRTRRALLLVGPILVVAAIAGVVSFSSRGDAAFQYEQEHPSTVDPRELELLVQKAPQPTPHGPGAAARSVDCTPGGHSPQRNPWSCTARYPSGKNIRYRITVRSNGSYTGADRTGQFLVRGCCVAGGTSAG